jgi:thiol-disulfide isomerase/thioredoxin
MVRVTPSWTIVMVALAAMVLPLTLAGCGKARETPEPSTESSAGAHDVISHGERVDLEDHLAAGKITVFDFSSEYCPPCVVLGPELEKLDARRDDLAVVTVDINRPGRTGIDWQSPVARQYFLRSIPHFIIYDADGRRMAEGRQAAEKVFGWLEE